MMMNLCILSLLIEDVVAMGNAEGLAGTVLLGKQTEVEKEVTEAPEDPEFLEEGEETRTNVVTAAPEEEEAAQTVSCGGHEAASCGECTNAEGAPEGASAASWCNGECMVVLDKDQMSCVAIESGYVSCGHHQAENCESCTNKEHNYGQFCHGACAFNGNNNKCELTP